MKNKINKEPVRIKPNSELAKALLSGLERKRLNKRYLCKEITFEEYVNLGGSRFAKPLNGDMYLDIEIKSNIEDEK